MRLRLTRPLGLLLVACLAASCAHTGGAPQHDAFGRPTATSSTTSTSAAVRPAGPREAQPFDATIRTVVADLQRFWAASFPGAYGADYEPMRTFYAYGPSTNMPVCDGVRLPYLLMQGNAFYCPDDDFIAWDEIGLFPRLDRVYGRFTIALVLAHEWGHAMQERGGVDEDTVIMEQQADCFAGAWARHLPTSPAGSALSLDREDLDGAVAGLVSFRDPVGLTPATEGSHGTGFDRVRAFQEGYAQGVARCVAYEDDPPTLVGLPFGDVRSMLFGGDAPFSKVVPNVAASLSAHWSDGSPIRVERLAGSRVASCDVTPIGVEGLPTNDLSYCPTDRTLRWREEAMRRIYDDIGDFAVSTLFGVIWAEVQDPPASHDGAGAVAEEPAVLTARALCQTGAWAREEYDRSDGTAPAEPHDEDRELATEPIGDGTPRLSPGDLDEAVQLLLGAEGVLATPRAGQPFARLDAFRVGFTDGDSAC